MNGRNWRYLLLICLTIVLGSCNSQTRKITDTACFTPAAGSKSGGCISRTREVTETDCTSVMAQVRYTWQVTYYRDRTKLNPEHSHVEDFETTTLVTVNGEKPEGADLGPDRTGVWYPKVPPSPSASDIEAARQVGEQFNPPQLKRRVRYSMQCSAGEFLVGRDWYPDLADVFRKRMTVKALYGDGRVSQAVLPSDRMLFPDQPSEVITTGAFKETENTEPDPFTPKRDRIPNEVYVDSQEGSDRAPGNEFEPFKTITHAIQKAKYGAKIYLKPGIYSTTTGEVFPLRIKPGLSLHASRYARGAEVRIVGGGKFLSPTWAGQNVTIVAEKDSRISGLTITNPNTRGTGIWIEAGSPTLQENRFVGCDRDGVFVSGNANPLILYNLFEKNGGNGLSFTRDSKGSMQQNQIRANGFGMAIGDRSAPFLYQNEIIQNKDGIVINGEARPELKANTITNNQRDGIVVTNQARPQLQSDVIRANGQYDIQNATGKPLQVRQINLAQLKTKGIQ